jgi:curli biogenesis system outer membrane secretion channel CsgG
MWTTMSRMRWSAVSQMSALLTVLTLGCALPPQATVRGGDGPDIASAQLEAYDGPKARVAVADFEDKVQKGPGYFYQPAYGSGLRDMLTTSLFQTNRYIVLEREQLKSVMIEQDLGASGRFKKETAAPIGELEGAEILVKAAITGWQPGTSGVSGSAGTLSSQLMNMGTAGMIGGAALQLAGSLQTSTIAMDLRLIDTRTGRVISATSVEGKARSFGLGGIGGGGGLDAFGALSGFAKTPMEQAVRECMDQAVAWIAKQTPKNYYHYDGMTGQALPVASAVVPK